MFFIFFITQNLLILNIRTWKGNRDLKKNLTIIALNTEFKKTIAKKLAKELDMLFVDVNEFVKYDLIDINQIIKTAGLEYYNKQETKAICMMKEYENALITLNNSTFFCNDNFKILMDFSVFIYLRVKFDDFKTLLLKERPNSYKYENMLNEKVFAERDKILTNLSDIVVNVKLKDKNLTEKVIKNIKKYYKDVLWKVNKL